MLYTGALFEHPLLGREKEVSGEQMGQEMGYPPDWR